MINTKKLFFLFSVVFFASNLLAQENFSIQLNSGISDFSGYSGSLQLNYSLNSDLDLYLYSGYSNVDEHNRLGHRGLDYTENLHSSGLFIGNSNMIPIYFGSSLDLFENEWITTFANLELGYSHLSFNTYESMIPVYSDNGEILRYTPDRSTAEKHKDNLFGAGIGVGAAHSLTSNIEILLNFKLNTSTNFGGMNMFSRRSTYTSLLAGINYGL